MSKLKLSVVLATRNEEENIRECLKSVKDVADEIIVVDEESIDNTRDIVRKMGAKVFIVKHEDIFHKTKQKALDKATGDWILQLDADERVSKELVKEIGAVVLNRHPEYVLESLSKQVRNDKERLFRKHQKLIEHKQGTLEKITGEVVAYFVPRVNYFLGAPLIHAGVYPDGVIRLVKKGKARFPAKSVHELMEIDGEVAWLFNDLEHHDSPTLTRYLERANRYTDLTANEFKESKLGVNYFQLINHSTLKPFFVFLNLYIRHKGFLDGMRGFVWSLFSALHFPIAYFKYWQVKKARYNTKYE